MTQSERRKTLLCTTITIVSIIAVLVAVAVIVMLVLSIDQMGPDPCQPKDLMPRFNPSNELPLIRSKGGQATVRVFGFLTIMSNNGTNFNETKYLNLDVLQVFYEMEPPGSYDHMYLDTTCALVNFRLEKTLIGYRIHSLVVKPKPPKSTHFVFSICPLGNQRIEFNPEEEYWSCTKRKTYSQCEIDVTILHPLSGSINSGLPRLAITFNILEFEFRNQTAADMQRFKKKKDCMYETKIVG